MKYKIFFVSFLYIFSLGVYPAIYADTVSLEYKLKAVYIYNFLNFVSWPTLSETNTPKMRICLLGDDVFGNAIQHIRGEIVKGRIIELRYITKFDRKDECQILFISKSEKRHISQILEQTRGTNVLTVSDIKDFVQKGGVIGFYTEANKVRLQINLQAAKDEGLHLSAKLLEISKIIPSEK